MLTRKKKHTFAKVLIQENHGMAQEPPNERSMWNKFGPSIKTYLKVIQYDY